MDRFLASVIQRNSPAIFEIRPYMLSTKIQCKRSRSKILTGPASNGGGSWKWVIQMLPSLVIS